MPWENFTTKGLTPRILFMDREEMRSVVNDFCRFNRCKTRPPLEKGDSTASADSAASPPAPSAPSPPNQQQNQQQNQQAFGADQKSFFDTLEWADDEVEAGEADTGGVLEPGVADLLGFVSPSAAPEEANGEGEGGEQLLNINGEEGGLLFEFNDDGDSASTPASAMPDDNFDPFVSAFGASGKTEQAAPAAAPEWTADFSAFDPFGSTAASDSGFQEAGPGSAEPLRPVSSSHNLFASAGGSGTATPTAFSSSATSSPRHSSANLSAAAAAPTSAPTSAPPQQKKSDPFADLGNLLGGNSSSRGKQKTGASPNRSASPRPDPKNIMGSGYKLGGAGPQVDFCFCV